ncbi:hypothetical protein [Rhodococcus sp. 14-2470-1b]|uniref:hypothetical protein n=1 Tax=Rhodococcus sp. 14-2470-1b TaxID=2023149 RepID=UPI001595C378|nr:hypothetical protein [Rhodococcus sp. 14-2470-1b]
MRIRTLTGPPLPAEIAANTARLLALVELNIARPQSEPNATANDRSRHARHC